MHMACWVRNGLPRTTLNSLPNLFMSTTRFKSTLQTAAAVIVGTVLGFGGANMYQGKLGDGSVVIRTDVIYVSSGGMLPISGSLDEDDRVGNGTQTGWVIQNPYAEQVLFRAGNIIVNTAGETTVVDISRGTGSLATAGVLTGVTLGDNIALTASRNIALSGSLLNPATGQNFILDARGGTNDYIIIGSISTQAGSGTELQYHFETYPLE